jgi:hypothetical protein
MDPVIELDQTHLTAEPGGQARVGVRVHNNNTIVEGFRIVVLGEAAAWARSIPEEISVSPQQAGVAQVLFSPPAGTGARAGQIPFGIQVVSLLDAMSSTVAEGDITVGAVSALNGRILPVASTGRWSGRHRVEIANWGNTHVRLALEASDPDQQLAFLVEPPVVDLPIGARVEVKVRVRTRVPVFRGAAPRRSFKVIGRPAGPDGRAIERPPNPGGWIDPSQVSVDGAFQQRAVFGKGATILGAVAVLALGIGVVAAVTGGGGGGDTGATGGAIAPFPVTGLAIDAGTSENSVTLTWDGRNDVDEFHIVQIDAATVHDAAPKLVDNLTAAGNLNVLPVKDLEAGKEYCFQIKAANQKVESAASAPVCGATKAAAGTAPPASPTIEDPSFVTGKGVTVHWKNPDGVDTVEVYRGDTLAETVTGKEEYVDANGTATDCYTVRSKVGDLKSDASESKCAVDNTPTTTTAAGAGGGGGATGGAFKDLGLLVVVHYSPSEDADAQARAQAEYDATWHPRFPDAVLANGDQFSGEVPSSIKGFWFIYVPFRTPDAVRQFCADPANADIQPCTPYNAG